MTPITIQVLVEAPLEKTWECWTSPDHITQWTFASEDWHSPHAVNDLRVGGSFTTRMEAKDGSMGFDFGGVYTAVKPFSHISYAMADDRQVNITFEAMGQHTLVTESFDPESENPVDMQREGWQAILNNFKRHTESNL